MNNKLISLFIKFIFFSNIFERFYELLPKTIQKKNIRLIAFYFPQFHRIPENDKWWGEGFTEWTMVKKAKPYFPGHYQPHIPSKEIGYYDLQDDRDIIKKQISLAKEYGINGFCFYHYWFEGRRLLEAPISRFLKENKDFQFCLCWANEDWVRRWGDSNNEILIKQKYSREDDIQHIKELILFFKNKNYIKVNGCPVILIYNASELPDPKNMLDIWIGEVKKNNFPGLYVCNVNSLGIENDPKKFGFDAAVEFSPSKITARGSERVGDSHCFDYKETAKFSLKYKTSYFRYPCVFPPWDNFARRSQGGATIFLNSNPKIYKEWLENVVKRFKPRSEEENFIFINAWNEWGEGAHLEPDEKYGKEFLIATKESLKVLDTEHSLLKKLFLKLADKIKFLSAERKELKFIHITKNAGTSIEDVGLAFGLKWGKFHEEYLTKRESIYENYLGWHDFPSYKKIELIKKYDWFMVVRNPYTRMISEFHWINERVDLSKMSKKQFNENLRKMIIKECHNEFGDHFSPQYRYLTKGIKIHILKFENLEYEFRKLMKKYKIKLRLKVKHNISNKKFDVNDLDSETIRLINEIYKKDFETFGYKLIESNS